MSQEYVELRGSGTLQLHRIDRVMSELARPALDESMSRSTREALLQLGVCVGGRASRKDLIESLWSRKRSLLRRLSPHGGRDPLRPVA